MKNTINAQNDRRGIRGSDCEVKKKKNKNARNKILMNSEVFSHKEKIPEEKHYNYINTGKFCLTKTIKSIHKNWSSFKYPACSN